MAAQAGEEQKHSRTEETGEGCRRTAGSAGLSGYDELVLWVSVMQTQSHNLESGHPKINLSPATLIPSYIKFVCLFVYLFPPVCYIYVHHPSKAAANKSMEPCYQSQGTLVCHGKHWLLGMSR